MLQNSTLLELVYRHLTNKSHSFTSQSFEWPLPFINHCVDAWLYCIKNVVQVQPSRTFSHFAAYGSQPWHAGQTVAAAAGGDIRRFVASPHVRKLCSLLPCARLFFAVCVPRLDGRRKHPSFRGCNSKLLVHFTPPRHLCISGIYCARIQLRRTSRAVVQPSPSFLLTCGSNFGVSLQHKRIYDLGRRALIICYLAFRLYRRANLTMTMSVPRAVQLKEEGNKYFQNGDFVSAEGLYSKAHVLLHPVRQTLTANLVSAASLQTLAMQPSTPTGPCPVYDCSSGTASSPTASNVSA
jgi:hypothetical protein